MAVEYITIEDANGTNRKVACDVVDTDNYSQVTKIAYGADGSLSLMDAKPATEATLAAQAGLGIPPYDAVSRAWNEGTLTETWSYFSGGLAGTLEATVTIIYTDASRSDIVSLVKS